MIKEKFDLRRAVARRNFLTANISSRQDTLKNIGSERAQIRVDNTKKPTDFSDDDFSTIERLGRVRQRVGQSITRHEQEIAQIDDQITDYAPVYSETLERRKTQIDRITGLHQAGFVKDEEFDAAISSFNSFAAFPDQSEALRRGLLALEHPVKEPNNLSQIEDSQNSEEKKEPKRPVGIVDLASSTLILEGDPISLTSSQMRVLQLIIENGGTISSGVLQQYVMSEHLTNRKHSPGSHIINKLRAKIGDSLIESEYDQSKKLPTYVLKGDFSLKTVEEEQGNKTEILDSTVVEIPTVVEAPVPSVTVTESEQIPERVNIVVDSENRTIDVGGIKIKIGSDARWGVFLKVASENGATAAELDQVLSDNGVVSKHPHQGPRTISSIRESFKQFGSAIKVEKSDQNERVYSLDANVTFLPAAAMATVEEPSVVNPVVEEIKREIDVPFIDNFSKGDIAVIASTCLTNREPIEKILRVNNLSLVETDVLKELTELVGDETLIPLTQLPNDQAARLIRQARAQAFSKVVDLFEDEHYEERMSEIFAKNSDVWQLIVNLSELSDLICKFGEKEENAQHPLVQIFSNRSKTMFFNMDNKKQVPQEFRFREGVTLESILSRINRHLESR